MPCRALIGIPGPLDASRMPSPPLCDNQKHLRHCQMSPGGRVSPAPLRAPPCADHSQDGQKQWVLDEGRWQVGRQRNIFRRMAAGAGPAAVQPWRWLLVATRASPSPCSLLQLTLQGYRNKAPDLCLMQCSSWPFQQC